MNPDQPDLFLDSEDDHFLLSTDDPKKQLKFEKVMQRILPQIPIHSDKIVLAQIMIALMIEGILKSPGEKEKKIISIIKNSILKDPEKYDKAFKMAKKMSKNPKTDD